MNWWATTISLPGMTNKRSIALLGYGDKGIFATSDSVKKATYTALLIEGKLPDYLADVNEQAEEMLFQLVNQIAKDEGVNKSLKRKDQMGWVGAMNSIRQRASEIINNKLIYN